VASIERYESGMAWVRDGVWGLAALGAFLGWLHFAEAMIFGGLAWFGLAFVRQVPRMVGRYRPFVVARWRAINRWLLVEVALIALIGELVRLEAISEPVASLMFCFFLAIFGMLIRMMWRAFLARGPHPPPPLP
jgi:hypothetical protein